MKTLGGLWTLKDQSLPEHPGWDRQHEIRTEKEAYNEREQKVFSSAHTYLPQHRFKSH